MAKISKDYAIQLDRIKKNVLTANTYFGKNYRRYHQFRRYAFEKTIDDNQEATLRDLGKPIIEFNIVAPYISRLLGEFAKHQPSIEVRSASSFPTDPQLLEVLEGHLRHIDYESNKNSYAYRVYKDLLGGGFSVVKVYPDFESAMSFDQIIKKERVFDPTLCGFDPMARYPHKGDGKFCFENYPKTLDDVKEQYPGIDVSKISFRRDIEGFNWSFLNNQEIEIVLFCEYYEKRYKKTRIVKLSNGVVITAKKYEKLQAFWEKQQFIEQIPKVIGKSRMSDIETIHRDLLIESEIIEHSETDYDFLPYVFVDGDSEILQEGTKNTTYQFTKPYIYHAKGIQDLKNFAGQSLGNYLENLVQHKFIIKKEALPQEEDYMDAINDHQHANTLVVNAYNDNNPDQPIPEPIREVVNVPSPPEVMGTFSQADQSTQMILGTFDAALGINDNQLSGVAVIESATQSNACAFPYLVGYLQAETQCANIAINLISKRMKNVSRLPVVSKEGKRDFTDVNNEGKPSLDFPEKSLAVEVSAGVNYAIAKNKALQQIFAMMQASPTAAEFFSTEGFPQILDNMEFHGSDIVKKKAEEWLEQKKSQPPQPSPEQMKMQAEMSKVQQKNQELQVKQQMHQSQLQIDIAKLQQDQMKVLADLKLSQDENFRESKRYEREHHLKAKDMEHKHNMDHHSSIRESVKLHHEMNQPEVKESA